MKKRYVLPRINKGVIEYIYRRETSKNNKEDN